uniref:CD99 molecule (Xg blood group) n=1 Tax=Xenopus tropicalis TaxID=8364 RepID=A0A6I8SX35_XENTR
MFRSLGLLLCVASLTLHIRGQEDFDLDQAFDDDVDVTTKPPLAPTKNTVEPKKPTPKPNPGGADDKGKETPKPKPGGGAGGAVDGGTISDDDLFDPAGKPLPDDPKDEGQNDEQPKSNLIAGIVGAVGAAAVGAVSSFIAYQKKKLCFKESNGDPENVNMESYKGDQAEPQVQTSLLAK